MRAHGRGQADTRSEMASLSRTRAMKSWPHSKVVDFLRRITEVMSSPHFLGFHSRPPFFVRSVQKKRKAKPPRRLHVWRNRFSVTQFSRAGHHLLRSFLPSPFNFSSASFRNHRSTTDIVLVLLFALSSLLPTTPLSLSFFLPSDFFRRLRARLRPFATRGTVASWPSASALTPRPNARRRGTDRAGRGSRSFSLLFCPLTLSCDQLEKLRIRH